MSNERLESNGEELTKEEGDFLEPEVRLHWMLVSNPFNCYSVTKQVELYPVNKTSRAPWGCLVLHLTASLSSSPQPSPDDGIYWQVNLDRFHQHFRDQAIVSAVANRMDQVISKWVNQ